MGLFSICFLHLTKLHLKPFEAFLDFFIFFPCDIYFLKASLSNHPVHLMNGKSLSPSSFIPFCEFGGDMNIVGTKIDQFDVPACNSFKAKILKDQLCYEIDLNEYKSNFTSENLKTGLTFLVDQNEDRQFSWRLKDKRVEQRGFDPKVKSSNNFIIFRLEHRKIFISE